MERIRVGFIGCGGNARGHMRRMLTMPEVEIVALADVSQESLGKVWQDYPQLKKLPFFTDYRQMLKEVRLDAVEISTPHTLHFQQAMDSLREGLHVLVEKPMVCTTEHAQQIVKQVESSGKVFLISYQRHFEAVFRYVRNQIRAGELGEVQFISAFLCQDWYRAQRGTWRQRLALSGGGQLNDSGSHLLDILLWMTGLEPEEVTAYIDCLDTEVDINSALSVRFTNGAIGNISVVGNSPGAFREGIEIWGSKAAVHYYNGELTYICAGASEPFQPTGLPYRSNPDQNFIDAILGRDEVQAPAICGLRVAQLTQAAWESARTGQPVKVRHT
ncbi:MAG: Gfo/Idh/MocA family oxidoreductase [Candidatus Latescibacteria bacterium]|nr:Gfo/Idh/MocA family oxidoreductase [Candidatus Latescibacterota bacterium]